MRLAISLAQEHRKRVFTSTDVMTGIVYFDVSDTLSISQIEFSIEARLRSGDTAAARAGYVTGPCYFTLFQSSQILFPEPPLIQSTRYTLGKGRHEYRFGVDFSLLSRYTRSQLLLDPSVSEMQRWESSHVSYSVCVMVKGCGLLRRRVSKSMFLTSVSLDPPSIPRQPLSRELSREACQVFPLCASGLDTPPQTGHDQSPPPYSPVIVLRAGISNDDDLLHAGDSVPLRLWITVPFIAQRKLDVHLKSVRLFLVDPTVVVVGRRRVVDLVGTVVRQVQLDVPLQTRFKDETFEVDSAPWRYCTVPRSLAEPRSPLEVSRPYLLQVLCELSCDGLSSTMFTSVLLPVSIATINAPPKYDVDGDQRKGPIAGDGLPRYETSEQQETGISAAVVGE